MNQPKRIVTAPNIWRLLGNIIKWDVMGWILAQLSTATSRVEPKKTRPTVGDDSTNRQLPGPDLVAKAQASTG